MGFLRSDGTPTDLYSRYRNPGQRGAAMAEAIKSGFAEVYERNEYAHELPREKFRDLIVEMTGLQKGNSVVSGIVGTFFALKALADFEASIEHQVPIQAPRSRSTKAEAQIESAENNLEDIENQEFGLNLSYTINLNLPETTNIDVFNAIFKSLRENLLRR